MSKKHYVHVPPGLGPIPGVPLPTIERRLCRVEEEAEHIWRRISRADGLISWLVYAVIAVGFLAIIAYGRSLRD